jgi:aspartyl-tRNA(Asn)/glutamyl-tRNA(Gln) amidotransferase subunit B
MREIAIDEKNLIEGKTGKWEVILGLEVHAQVISNSKLFSGAATAFGAEPNTQVSLVDAGFPGMLPVINEICIEQAVSTGLGLKAGDQPQVGVRPEELFLRRSAGRLSDLQFTQPIVGKGIDHARLAGRLEAPKSASPACIWSRMPARACTTSTRPRATSI